MEGLQGGGGKGELPKRWHNPGPPGGGGGRYSACIFVF